MMHDGCQCMFLFQKQQKYVHTLEFGEYFLIPLHLYFPPAELVCIYIKHSSIRLMISERFQAPTKNDFDINVKNTTVILARPQNLVVKMQTLTLTTS